MGAGVVKLGLSEKHTKFEKIFLMVWIFTKDGFRGNDSLILRILVPPGQIFRRNCFRLLINIL